VPLQFGGEREPNSKEGVPIQFDLKGIRRHKRGGFMSALTHFKTRGDSFFHFDPQQLVFLLVASFVLAALVVLLLVPSAR
jgi:hypothetical protein